MHGLLAHCLLGLVSAPRIGRERQHPAELAGDAADRVAQPLVTELRTDEAAYRLGILADHVADPALWCNLTLTVALTVALSLSLRLLGGQLLL